ncbi:hypothetical protein MVES1_000121 [Malassezia vespertilionis]|uniref:Uncharacterized protein n=1 Tax=Malassezia vespertilionis TaxID=2020962 RepID=A0A2N1JFR6_9BASI|nr:uncharacterized protein MVES1_000121 [Malassezia vespertilionis]PKI85404.1 hypothetical protein MVES_000120 [Malassezia vespertilionis]WFD04797.1 hypothetical protein MVES1_000121 [Malassezia vespertilionis]
MLARTLLLCVFLPLCLAQSSGGFSNPSKKGGKPLTVSKSTKGEPLNVIISGKSDPYVSSQDGFASFSRSINFGNGSCLDIRGNNTAQANLGDGDGTKDEAGLFRWDNGCTEALNGGNHFRYWVQNGSAADTKAIFIAASVEMPLNKDHNIVPNGYDMGRDQFVGNATQGITVDQDTGNKFQTTIVANNTSLMKGISKNDLNHNIGTDGEVTVLQVKLTKKGSGSQDDQASDNGQTSLVSFLPFVQMLSLATAGVLVLCT